MLFKVLCPSCGSNQMIIESEGEQAFLSARTLNVTISIHTLTSLICGIIIL